MIKQESLAQLRKELSGLPQDEVQMPLRFLWKPIQEMLRVVCLQIRFLLRILIPAKLMFQRL